MANKKKNPLTLPYITAFVIVAVILLGYIGWNFAFKGYSGSDHKLIIPSGSSEQAIADSLSSIDDSYAFKVKTIWKLAGGKPSRATGYYLVKKGMTPVELARKLKRGEQTPIKVTFNNIRTLNQLADRISSQFDFTSEEFLAAADSVLKPEGFKNRSEYPAAFIPDSYEFYWNASPQKVIRTLLKYRNKFWDGDRRSQASDMGLNPVKVAIIASIVEEESAKTDERPKIARLYMNRIKKGMPLQADPTVKFAIGDFGIRRITNDMLRANSPYNTYLNPGLPPGPIRIPDRRTLQQVLDAPEHNYLYMCAKEDFSGYHNFAVDFAEHSRNAAKYRAELNRRGIK